MQQHNQTEQNSIWLSSLYHACMLLRQKGKWHADDAGGYRIQSPHIAIFGQTLQRSATGCNSGGAETLQARSEIVGIHAAYTLGKHFLLMTTTVPAPCNGGVLFLKAPLTANLSFAACMCSFTATSKPAPHFPPASFFRTTVSPALRGGPFQGCSIIQVALPPPGHDLRLVQGALVWRFHRPLRLGHGIRNTAWNVKVIGCWCPSKPQKMVTLKNFLMHMKEVHLCCAPSGIGV
ncbi:hypothetical protein EDD15DRAFT_2196782 [Pisolithus albus]|nr:hypothetical protein EDD15DRAFT_2196782 [Pisolithus albus]